MQRNEVIIEIEGNVKSERFGELLELILAALSNRKSTEFVLKDPSGFPTRGFISVIGNLFELKLDITNGFKPPVLLDISGVKTASSYDLDLDLDGRKVKVFYSDTIHRIELRKENALNSRPPVAAPATPPPVIVPEVTIAPTFASEFTSVMNGISGMISIFKNRFGDYMC